MPLETLDAYRRLGRPELRLERHIAEGCDAREGLERLDVDLEAVAAQLEREGVRKFIEPFDRLQQWLEERRRGRPASPGPPGGGGGTQAGTGPPLQRRDQLRPRGTAA